MHYYTPTYLNLIILGNSLLQGKKIEVTELQGNFMQDGLQFVCNEDGLAVDFDTYYEWLQYMIKVKQVKSFHFFDWNKEIVGEDFVKHIENQPFFESKNLFNPLIECRFHNNTSDLYGILPNLKKRFRPEVTMILLTVFEGINYYFTINESEQELIDISISRIDNALRFVEMKASVLTPHFNNIKEALLGKIDFPHYIINTGFSEIESKIITANIYSGGAVNVLSHNSSSLTNDEFNFLIHELDQSLCTTLMKALVKIFQKKNEKVTFFNKIFGRFKR